MKMHFRLAGQKSFQTRFTHGDRDSVQTPNLYLKLTNLNEKGTYYYFFNIYQSSIDCRFGTGNPVLPNQL